MKFLSVFALTQIPLAVIEGLLGVLVFRTLRRIAVPELAGLSVLTRHNRAEAQTQTKDSYVAS